MLKEGRRKTEGTVHIENTFVWHPNMVHVAKLDQIVRVSFYTSAVGDELRISNIQDQISSIVYSPAGYGRKIHPRVFKKAAKSQKSKNVDIAITIDALRHCYLNHVDDLCLFSGDGDYIPLIQEVMRSGKRVTLGALSSGLNPDLKRSVDSFIDLDQQFFLPEQAIRT